MAPAVPRQEGHPDPVQVPQDDGVAGLPEGRVHIHGFHPGHAVHLVETAAADNPY